MYKLIIRLVLFFCLIVTGSCDDKTKPVEAIVSGSADIQLFPNLLPASNVPPFLFFSSSGSTDDNCVKSKDQSKWETAGEDLIRDKKTELETKIKAEFNTELKKIALEAGLNIDMLNKLNINVNASKIKVNKINVTSIDFKNDPTCMNYLYDMRNKYLVNEVYKAETVSITISNLNKSIINSIIKAKLLKIHGIDLEVGTKSKNALEFKNKGKNLIFGYRAPRYIIQYYGDKKPLKLSLPIDKEIEVKDILWVNGFRIRENGKTSKGDIIYKVFIYTFAGKDITEELIIGDSKEINIGLQQKLAIHISEITKKNELVLKITGFRVKF